MGGMWAWWGGGWAGVPPTLGSQNGGGEEAMAAPAAASGGVRMRGAGRDKMAATRVTCRAQGDGGLREGAEPGGESVSGGSQ